jgi:hypothetical protein
MVGHQACAPPKKLDPSRSDPPFSQEQNSVAMLPGKVTVAWCQWLSAIILATSEAEIGRIKVRGQPGQIVHKTSISKITRAK